MPNQQLLQYINQRRVAGLADSQIKEEVQKAGWSDFEIALVFAPTSVTPPVPPPAPSTPTMPGVVSTMANQIKNTVTNEISSDVSSKVRSFVRSFFFR